MQRCRFPTTIILGFALAGCGSEDSKAPADSSTHSGGDAEVADSGFIGTNTGGGLADGGSSSSGTGGSGRFVGGGFGGAVWQPDESFEGEIDGDYVLQPSGKYIERFSGKGGAPLVIKIKSELLPLMPETDEIGEQMLKLSGSHVRLKGHRMTTVSSGRPDGGGQQGDRHSGFPDHRVHFLTVHSVEAL